jgi:hypothetical protein
MALRFAPGLHMLRPWLPNPRIRTTSLSATHFLRSSTVDWR